MRVRYWKRKVGVILFWMLVWQVMSLTVRSSIILVGPAAAARALAVQARSAGFWQTILFSFVRISMGFLSAFAAGLALGSASCRFPFLKELFAPVIALMKSIPVASFIILALIWIGSRNLSVLTSFLMVFPILYGSAVSGLESTERDLLEMARVFRMPFWRRVRYIYRPALAPYLISGCQTALGMSWKSGIAAEVIGVPTHSIGEKLYMAKIYLNTADLFAWTFVIILVSILSEKLFLAALRRIV